VGEALPSNQHAARLSIVALAWAGILLASTLPAIVWGQFAPEKAIDPVWLPATIWVQVGGLVLLLVVALV
jgi:hypothetical protein